MPENPAASSAPKRPRGRPSHVRASGSLASAALIAAGPGAEDPRAFAEFALPLRAELAPQGPLEALLAERVIGNAWRLRRALRFEAAHIQESLDMTDRARRLFARATFIPPDIAKSSEELSENIHRKMPPASLQSLLRYESFLERSLLRALHELERLQGLRSRGARQPTPGTADPEFPFPSENKESSQISSEK